MRWQFYKQIAGAILIVAVLATVAVSVYTHRGISADASQLQLLKDRWREHFKTLPTEQAYADFLNEGNKLSYLDAHLLAHVAGEVLYEQYGIAGMRFCTPDFGFGCYHGLSGLAFIQNGLSVMQTLRDACPNENTEQFLGCMHGLGHGLLAYLGNNSLMQALDMCAPLQLHEPIGGCFGGIFMEYNYNTFQSLDGFDLRLFDKKKAYEPCAHGMPEAYKPSCYYELPSWWRATFEERSMPVNEQYEKAGALCAVAPDFDMRPVCFRGIGNVIGPLSGYKADRMRQWCALMPDSVAERDCLNEAAGHLRSAKGGASELASLCKEGVVNSPLCFEVNN